MPQAVDLLEVAVIFGLVAVLSKVARYFIGSPYYTPCLRSNWRKRADGLLGIAQWVLLFLVFVSALLAWAVHIIS